MWRVPLLPGRPATWSDAEQITFDQAFAEFVDVSPDGERLVVTSDRAGNPDLWTLSSSDRSMTQLTTDPTPDWNGRWSPDATQIAFYAYRTGAREIWVMPVDGGRARQVTTRGAIFPAWSPDGHEIAFTSTLRGALLVVPTQGGDARQLLDESHSVSFPSWSPDGEWIAYSGHAGVWRVERDSGETEQLSDKAGADIDWSADGETLYFADRDNLWSLSIEDGIETQLTDLTGRRGTLGISMATDEEFLYFTWEEDLGDIWVMDVVTDE